MALREHFFALFARRRGARRVLGGALLHGDAGSASASPPTCATRSTPTSSKQSPEFFETTQTGEVLSRLTTDTTLVQTVVGSSLSMGLRNAVMGIGALAMLIVTNPYVMTQVLGILVLVVLPTPVLRPARAQAQPRQPGPRGRLERDRRRGAERDSGGAELHGEAREAARFDASTESAFATAMQAHAHALGAGRVHHHRHLRRAAVGPVPGHAGGDARRHHAPATWARRWCT